MQEKNGLRSAVKSTPFRAALAMLCFFALALGGNLSVREISGATILANANPESLVLDAGTKGKEKQPSSFSDAVLGVTSSTQIGQSGDNGMWRFLDDNSSPGAGQSASAPQIHKTARLDPKALTELLRQAPLEFTDSAIKKPLVMTLPMADGKFAGFRVEESPIMEPGLAAQFPEIKTYQAQSVDDPTTTARFDWTPLGLHAIILSPQGTSFIEPFSEGDTSNYVIYFNRDVSTDNLSLSCQLSESEIGDAESRGVSQLKTANFVTGSTLRTYRLAVAATAEFTQQYGGGNVSTTLTKITTLINQITAVYQKSATIRFQLVSNETSIIFTDPATDGYTNDTPSTMLAENQSRLDAILGSSNYDIGHVFGSISVGPSSISFSGVAGIGVVCAAGNKGRGVSTMGGASGSFPHSIFVSGTTHEIGHQFSAPHSFNSLTGGCSGQRSSSGAYEPGSGSTIMGYSICGADNLQSLPDLYFHTSSLERIVTYAAAGGNCATTTATANGAPVIGTFNNFTIPASTPFVLDGSATDPDGDALTYTWEEYDLGSASPPNTDDGTRPLFRSLPPSTNSSRTFPRLQYILNNSNMPPQSYTCGSSSCLTGELLPSTTRTMNFRFTARDDRVAGGGSASANQQVSVVSSAGPFAVTQPNTAVTWPGGLPQNITWNVAGTTAAPISAANVKISMSTDGGNSFPIIVAASTPNDGSESVVIPSVSTTTARIKVEAVGNIFFDISDTNFTITSVGITVTVQTNPVGRSFTVDGTSYTTTQTFSWVPASSHTISTTTPQSGSTGVRYLWSNWSDGGAISHTVSPATSTTYTANFATQFFLTMNAGTGGTVTPASNWFNAGQSVTINAIPNTGFVFAGWTGTGTGSFTGSNNPSSVTMNGPITETASFTAVTPSGASTIGLYDPTGGAFYFKFSNTSGPSDYAFTFGPANQGWTPVIGDWNGDGIDTIGLYYPANGAFFIRNSNNSGIADIYITYGPAGQGWLPVIGDWDGNGTDTVGLYNPGNGFFYLRNSNTVGFADLTFAFGPVGQGWIPIVGDWDGDGIDTVGLYNPATGAVQLRNSNTTGAANVSFTFTGGASTWKVIVGDWDGNGTSTLGLYNPATGVFFLRNTNSTGGADITATWEGGNYVPLAGKWQ